ncbi:hypothetical protein RDI58_005867 [Solanum bulbocastanum]|uniref:Uncharacterized protein n=1 Tax=Solanum bulbocastanum TaxID=147425 RepID=A0AAN8U0S3_SOLBU
MFIKSFTTEITIIGFASEWLRLRYLTLDMPRKIGPMIWPRDSLNDPPNGKGVSR